MIAATLQHINLGAKQPDSVSEISAELTNTHAVVGLVELMAESD